MQGIGIGVRDFKMLRVRNNYFIDKSLFRKDIIDNQSSVALITRPRRFGKTLNMSMLKYYFDCTKKDSKELFEGLKIMEQGEEYTLKLGYYPVIYITLKDVNDTTYEKMLLDMKTSILDMYKEHMYLLESDKIYDFEKEQIKEILWCREDETLLKNSIKLLSQLLSRYFDKPVILLVDEYDVPLQNAYVEGYYEDAIKFFKTFYGVTFKDNPYLEKTEILLKDEAIEVPINLETIIVGIEKNENNIWGLLLGTGYLKVVETVDLASGVYKVKIPNYEIKLLFEGIIKDWFNDKVIGNDLKSILKDLVTLNLEEFEEKFKILVRQMFSFMDVGENTAENFYHAFVLGMLVGLKDTYYVNSNRESGIGRYDIMLEPKDKNGNSFIMEFKVYKTEKEKDIEDTINNAIKQIEEKKYEESLKERGFTNITKMVFAFKGKEVKMKVY